MGSVAEEYYFRNSIKNTINKKKYCLHHSKWTYRPVKTIFPVSILDKSIAGLYRPVRVADGPITARYRFIMNASWVI